MISKKKSFSFYDVVFPSPLNKENWMEGKCDCGRFFKECICEHVIAIACRLKLTTVREEVEQSNIPIGNKRCRGRSQSRFSVSINVNEIKQKNNLTMADEPKNKNDAIV